MQMVGGVHDDARNEAAGQDVGSLADGGNELRPIDSSVRGFPDPERAVRADHVKHPRIDVVHRHAPDGRVVHHGTVVAGVDVSPGCSAVGGFVDTTRAHSTDRRGAKPDRTRVEWIQCERLGIANSRGRDPCPRANGSERVALSNAGWSRVRIRLGGRINRTHRVAGSDTCNTEASDDAPSVHVCHHCPSARLFAICLIASRFSRQIAGFRSTGAAGAGPAIRVRSPL